MKLTGKCLEDFIKYRLTLHKKWVDEVDESCVYYGYSEFNNLPESMQWGVYQDFFNSEEIYITLVNDFEFISVEINRNEVYKGDIFSEARTNAIEKANEIYNEL